MRKIIRSVVAMITGIVLFSGAAHATTHEFYKGKTIKIVVGFLAGDVYDLWARLYAQHMPKHIPGKPDIIVQNMTGAGSMIAANHVYSVAKPDGLTLGSALPALYFDQLIGRKEVQFDYAKFAWIGSPVQNEHQMYMRSDAPYRTIEDIRKATVPPKCGTTGTGSTGYYIPKLMEDALGTKFNLVTGYQGARILTLPWSGENYTAGRLPSRLSSPVSPSSRGAKKGSSEM
jgi:tripartite-type tricarboxylate transporter receptor subunit TctC